MTDLVQERYTAIHLLRADHSVKEVARQLKRSPRWVRKWRKRFDKEEWPGLEGRSRAPHNHGTRFPESTRRAIAQTRSELEAKACQGDGLKYIGGIAVRTRLKEKGEHPLPSLSTIERVLGEKKMTHPYQLKDRPKIKYPHLQPREPQQLCQVDIVPHFLTGGETVACFNALDVVSRYPTGQACAQKRSQDAANFLIHLWQTVGIAHYTQVDNESCFSGGFTHPHVLGKVVRLALHVGTELVFSPVRHPQSNGFVERFHQDYNLHVWQDTYLENRDAVQTQGDHFFELYRHSRHHSALNGKTPQEVHWQIASPLLASDFCLPKQKLPLREGRLHFIRRVHADCTISVLNVSWPVPDVAPDTGVWATLEISCSGATLSIYDAAPEQEKRSCLIRHSFPLLEAVEPREKIDDTDNGEPYALLIASVGEIVRSSASLAWVAFTRTIRLANGLMRGTIY